MHKGEIFENILLLGELNFYIRVREITFTLIARIAKNKIMTVLIRTYTYTRTIIAHDNFVKIQFMSFMFTI